MADIPTVPTIFDGADLGRLKIRGASYKAIETPAGRLCVPTHFILGYKWRRWEVTVSDIYETDKYGKRLLTEPAPNNKLPPSCFSCDHFTMFGAQEGCGRPKEAPCPHGLDTLAKSAREYHQDKFAGVPRASTPPESPLPTDDRQVLYEEVLAQRERARIAERRVKELEETVILRDKAMAGLGGGLASRVTELEEKLKECEAAFEAGEQDRVDAVHRADDAEARLAAAQKQLRQHVEDCAKCPHIAEISSLESENAKLRGRTCNAYGPGCYASCRNPCMSPPPALAASKGCPKCNDPRVQQLPDPTEPESYSVIRCPACGWSTRCSGPAPAAPDPKGGE
jgi:hypothetical protein